MRALLAVAAFLLASTAAQAQYTFEYGGRTIRVDPDRGTVSIPGVYDNTKQKTKRSQDGERPQKQAPQEAKTEPRAPAASPAPSETAVAPATTSREPPASTANITPTDTIGSTPSPSSAPAPQFQEAAPTARPAPAPPPVVATAPAAPGPRQQNPVASANSPIGIWLTEEKEGKVRIEQCGANLCGYSVNAQSNQNGEQVLINMKPGKDKWSGRIFDPNSGSTYDSTIALKGSDGLRVQGCAFGGMFCGGQTWTRVN